ncbi:MAG TPA: isoprenylcysteine carboxylmethyltransferase family protein [Candidatus Acidoferrales bacterium]|nr:isoprenylcysteine carboxylmethyltransferase family protein [Candidatus Acidoferrales bacterium]
MPLVEELESVGDWLFRWRSYLPLAAAASAFAGLEDFRYPYGSHLLDELWEAFCLAVSFSGLAIRAVTVGSTISRTSGRNTAAQLAADLNTTGMYSIVRNPLYLGNFVAVLGVVIFLRVWWIALIYVLTFALYYERIIFAEEMFLRRKFGERYVEWASRTPAFFPRFSQWRPPSLPFNWKKVLRREYHGPAAVVASMFLLEAAGDLYSGHGLEIDSLWRILLPLAFGFYFAVRFLHKRTDVLRTGRKGREWARS